MQTQPEYRQVLEDLLGKITDELSSFAVQNSETGDWEVSVDKTEQPETDENSEADASESLEGETATLAELETSYRNITRALQKIDTGTFGTCEVCGGAIAPERLAILPSARTCTEHLDDERTLPL
jgi:DnaK suppressor protein